MVNGLAREAPRFGGKLVYSLFTIHALVGD
jgi:hypothetical protein